MQRIQHSYGCHGCILAALLQRNVRVSPHSDIGLVRPAWKIVRHLGVQCDHEIDHWRARANECIPVAWSVERNRNAGHGQRADCRRMHTRCNVTRLTARQHSKFLATKMRQTRFRQDAAKRISSRHEQDADAFFNTFGRYRGQVLGRSGMTFDPMHTSPTCIIENRKVAVAFGFE